MNKLAITHMFVDGTANLALFIEPLFDAVVKRCRISDLPPELLKENAYKGLRNFDPDEDIRVPFVFKDGEGLIVKSDGSVVRMSGIQADEFLRACGSALSHGCMETAVRVSVDVYAAQLEVSERLGLPMSSSKVCREVEEITGVTIRGGLIDAFGLDISRISIGRPEDKATIVTLKNEEAHIEELIVHGKSALFTRNSVGGIGRGKRDGYTAADRIVLDKECLTVGCDHAIGEIACADPFPQLMGVSGYSALSADFTAFMKLRTLTECFNWERSYIKGEISDFVLTSVKLPPSLDNILSSFIGCRVPPELARIDLTRYSAVTGSFTRVRGIESIAGEIDCIDGSFLFETQGNRQPLNVDITVKRCSNHALAYCAHDDGSLVVAGEVRVALAENAIPTIVPQLKGLIYRVIGGPYSKLAVAGIKSRTIIDAKVDNLEVTGDMSLITANRPPAVLSCLGSYAGNIVAKTIKAGIGVRTFSNPITIIPEGTEIIEKGAFKDAFGAERLVLPRSLVEAGNGAFSGLSCDKGLTDIYVYRDSYAHKWSKGKKSKVRVIDDLSEVGALNAPPDTSESESVAVLSGVPDNVNHCRNLYLAYMSADSDNASFSRFFKRESIAQLPMPLPIKEKPNEPKTTDAAYRHIALSVAQHALFGDNIDLLRPEVLSKFVWRVRYAIQVDGESLTLYTGKCMFAPSNAVGHPDTCLVMRGTESVIRAGIFVDNIVSCEWDFTGNLWGAIDDSYIGSLMIETHYREKSSVSVGKEKMPEPIGSKVADALYKTCVRLASVQGAVSGTQTDSYDYLFDVLNNRVLAMRGLLDSPSRVLYKIVPVADIASLRMFPDSRTVFEYFAQGLLQKVIADCPRYSPPDSNVLQAYPCREAQVAAEIWPYSPEEDISERRKDLGKLAEFMRRCPELVVKVKRDYKKEFNYVIKDDVSRMRVAKIKTKVKGGLRYYVEFERDKVCECYSMFTEPFELLNALVMPEKFIDDSAILKKYDDRGVVPFTNTHCGEEGFFGIHLATGKFVWAAVGIEYGVRKPFSGTIICALDGAAAAKELCAKSDASFGVESPIDLSEIVNRYGTLLGRRWDDNRAQNTLRAFTGADVRTPCYSTLLMDYARS